MDKAPAKRRQAVFAVSCTAAAMTSLVLWSGQPVVSKSRPAAADAPGRPTSDAQAVRSGSTESEAVRTPAPFGLDDILTVRPGRWRPQAKRYTVQKGDTLWDLARTYHTDVDSILSINDLKEPNNLQIGMELQIPLSVTLQRIDSGPSPADVITVDPEETARPRRMVASRGGTERSRSGSATMNWPLTGEITSRYGPRWGKEHTGLDIAAPEGTAIQAAIGGTVVFAGWDGAYGLSVILEHADGLRTRYAHASKLQATPGQEVTEGTVIAEVGSTGNSTGPHLHFEVLAGEIRRDPLAYLR